MNYEVVGRTVIGTYATVVQADSPNEAIKKGYRKLAPHAGSYLLKQTWIADSWESAPEKICQYKNRDTVCTVKKNKAKRVTVCPLLSRPADCGYCFVDDNEEYKG